MAIYLIENTASGVVLGCFQASSEAGALDAFARDAGYSDYSEVELEFPSKEGEILVTEVTEQECSVICEEHGVGLVTERGAEE